MSGSRVISRGSIELNIQTSKLRIDEEVVVVVVTLTLTDALAKTATPALRMFLASPEKFPRPPLYLTLARSFMELILWLLSGFFVALDDYYTLSRLWHFTFGPN